MGKCVAVIGANNEKCLKDTPWQFKYCEAHKDRPKAEKERAERNLKIVSSEVSDETVAESEAEITRLVKRSTDEISGSVLLEKVTQMINNITAFEDFAYNKVNELEGEIRFQDRAGAEQLRSEVAIYERALDRSSRVLTAVAKLGIDAQLASATKQQREMIEGVLTRTLARIGLSNEQLQEARSVMADEFRKVSSA